MPDCNDNVALFVGDKQRTDHGFFHPAFGNFTTASVLVNTPAVQVACLEGHVFFTGVRSVYYFDIKDNTMSTISDFDFGAPTSNLGIAVDETTSTLFVVVSKVGIKAAKYNISGDTLEVDVVRDIHVGPADFACNGMIFVKYNG